MAAAKKCDRCGKYYDTNKRHMLSNRCSDIKDGIAFTAISGNRSKQIDLCDDCIEKLDIFLSGIELVGYEKED